MTVTEIRQDFDPEKWGPHAWKFLHTITFSYPDNPHPDIQEQFKQFFRSLGVTLPCAKCRDHFAEAFWRTVDDHEDDPFKNKESLTQWLIEIHNAVNGRNRKPTISPSQAKRLYTAKDLLCSGQKGGGSAARGAAEHAQGGSWSPLFVLIVVFLIIIALVLGAVSYRRCFAQ